MVALELLQRVALLADLQALSDHGVEVDEDVVAQQVVDLLLARRVLDGERPELGRLVRGVVKDVHLGVLCAQRTGPVDETLECRLLRRFVVRPEALVAALGTPAPQVLDAALSAHIRIALKVEEHVTRARVGKPPVAHASDRWQVPTRRTPSLARLDLQGGLVAQNVVGVVAERSRIELARRRGQSRHRAEPQVNELLALIAASECDEAEVVVRAPARLAFEAQGADRAVRDRLGVCRHRLADPPQCFNPPNNVAMQCRISAERHLLDPPVAQDHVRERLVAALGLPEQPAVEAELVNDIRLDLSRKLGVEHLIGVVPEV